MPVINSWAVEYASQGFMAIGIDYEDFGTQMPWIMENPNILFLTDPEKTTAFGPYQIGPVPMTFLIDREGNIVFSANIFNQSDLDAAIETCIGAVGSEKTTDIAQVNSQVQLFQNTNNGLSYNLKTPGRTRLSIFNVLGNVAKELTVSESKAGTTEVDISGLPAGIYISRLEAFNSVVSCRFNVIK